jgi:hypothetical protein
LWCGFCSLRARGVGKRFCIRHWQGRTYSQGEDRYNKTVVCFGPETTAEPSVRFLRCFDYLRRGIDEQLGIPSASDAIQHYARSLLLFSAQIGVLCLKNVVDSFIIGSATIGRQVEVFVRLGEGSAAD